MPTIIEWSGIASDSTYRKVPSDRVRTRGAKSPKIDAMRLARVTSAADTDAVPEPGGSVVAARRRSSGVSNPGRARGVP